MAIRGSVQVKNGRYRFEGAFHNGEPNLPIRNDEGKLMGITNPREIVHVHAYGGEGVFFESLSQGKILGTKCENSKCEYVGTVYLPFRIHCPDCLAKNAVLDLTDICRETATVHTFMVCERSGAFNTLKKPVKFINIEFKGISTILMSYLSVGEPAFNMKVIPIFRTKEPTYTITDLSWVSAGTPESALPGGFNF